MIAVSNLREILRRRNRSSDCMLLPIRCVSSIVWCLLLISSGAASWAQSPDDASGAEGKNSSVSAETIGPAGGSGPESSEVTAASKSDVKEVPFPLRPYQVRIEVAVSDDMRSSMLDSSELNSAVLKNLNRMYGGLLRSEIVTSRVLLPVSESRLSSLTAKNVRELLPEHTSQKVMLIAVVSKNGEWTVFCREYDVLVDDLAQPVRRVTQDEREIPGLIADVIRECFRPVLMVENSGAGAGNGRLELLLQGGELSVPDAAAAQVQNGDVLRPFLRYLNRRDPSRTELLQALPLTYVHVLSVNDEMKNPEVAAADDVVVDGRSADSTASFVNRSRVSGLLLSHGRVPFGGRGRNVQQIALRQRPTESESRVRLALRARPDRPLVMTRVDRIFKLRTDDSSERPVNTMLSDRKGELRVPVDEHSRICWLYVYSGRLLLARVPYVPGLHQTDTILLPDDSLRLAVEGELVLFRERLVDSVAKLAVVRVLARRAGDSRDKEQIEAALKAISDLPEQKTFEADLNAIRVSSLERAREQKNRSAERAIEKLCRTMEESLSTFFQSEKHLQDMAEIQNLRRILAESVSGETASGS